MLYVPPSRMGVATSRTVWDSDRFVRPGRSLVPARVTAQDTELGPRIVVIVEVTCDIPDGMTTVDELRQQLHAKLRRQLPEREVIHVGGICWSGNPCSDSRELEYYVPSLNNVPGSW